jgi:hypothetical protein
MRTICIAALAGSLLLGCRHKDRLAQIDFAAEEAGEDVDAEATLAPPWPAAARATLDNGAILQWLEEEGSPALHLRLILPTTAQEQTPDAATTTVVVTAVQNELRRRLRRIDAQVGVNHRPGRVELVVHGRAEDAARIITSLSLTLANKKPERVLAQAQGKVTAAYRSPDASGRAASALTAALLELDPLQESAGKQAVVSLGKQELTRAWTSLLDPRDAVLVVHAGLSPESIADPIATLARQWQGRGRHQTKDAVLARVRTRAPEGKRRTRLSGDPKAKLLVLDADAEGRGIVMLGRVIRTKDPIDRAYARLTQRMLQEEVDARLLVAGELSLLSVRVPLSKRDPAKSLQQTLDRLERFASTEHQLERVRHAAELWLGARVVEISLEGEDWTSLWSESLDLAQDDASIGSALAVDARAMLDADQVKLRKWQEKWLRPGGGEPGWIWVAAGVDEETQGKLSSMTPIASR